MAYACQKCGKTHATVHLTDILDGSKREYHFCGECAKGEGIVPTQPQFTQLLQHIVAQKPEYMAIAALQCDVCGLKFGEFRASGLLGCPNDYVAFQRGLDPLIERSHEGHLQHCGKTPRRATQEVRAKIDLVRLRRELKAAVDAEEYETAARLRDHIGKLEGL